MCVCRCRLSTTGGTPSLMRVSRRSSSRWGASGPSAIPRLSARAHQTSSLQNADLRRDPLNKDHGECRERRRRRPASREDEGHPRRPLPGRCRLCFRAGRRAYQPDPSTRAAGNAFRLNPKHTGAGMFSLYCGRHVTCYPGYMTASQRSAMGAALLRRRPKGLLRAARQELLDPSKVWWGGRRGRLADRPRYSISVSLGVVPLVLPRRGSPSTHRSRGWLRSTRSFRTASAPTKLATRRVRTRAWMKQGCCVAPACTSELHPVADQVPHAPSMTPVAMEHRHRLADVLGHVDEVDYHTVRSTAALARSSCVSAPSTSATHPGAQPAPSRRSSPGGVPAGAAASARHRRPPRPDRRPPPGCVDRGVLAGACASTPGPVGAAPVRARSQSSAGLRAMRGRLWRQRRRPRPPHTAPGRGERRCEPRLASLNSPATAGPCWAPHRHGGSVGPCDLDRWWHPTRPRRHVPRTSSSLLRPSQRHLPSQGTVPKRRANVQGAEGTTEASGRRD